ncbi:MAG: PilZ domain-containing protein [Candidatus Hydrogenedentes bacterium]|nr:PilZ domain-containing protein [Candidatus Hydrogenedentota bacterium]
MNSTQQIRERRIGTSGTLTYHYDGGECGAAHWLDVSRVGAKLRLGRYLRPGRQLEIEFASPLSGDAIRVAARVMWCQMKGAAEFLAGIHVRREQPETALAFASLGYQGLDTMPPANIAAGSEVSSNVWPHFRPLESAGWEPAAAVQQAV